MWVYHCFLQKLTGEKFSPPKISARAITMMPMQQSNKQTDPSNAFVENERKIWETLWWAMENENLFQKNSKVSALFLLKKEFWRKISQTSAELIDVSLIRAKILAFPS